MAYKFHEAQLLDRRFNTIFGTRFQPFYDGLMSVMSQHLCIDIIKFDDWLHEKVGIYENDGLSMKDAIRQHYGEKGEKLIIELM